MHGHREPANGPQYPDSSRAVGYFVETGSWEEIHSTTRDAPNECGPCRPGHGTRLRLRQRWLASSRFSGLALRLPPVQPLSPNIFRPVNARFSRRGGASLSLPATHSAPGEDEILGPAIWGKGEETKDDYLGLTPMANNPQRGNPVVAKNTTTTIRNNARSLATMHSSCVRGSSASLARIPRLPSPVRPSAASGLWPEKGRGNRNESSRSRSWRVRRAAATDGG